MSEHWHDTVCYANYLLITMFVQLCQEAGNARDLVDFLYYLFYLST
ncbi:MAG: hypothetical protein ACR5K3_00495 [Wolbachia sp.]